MPSDLVPETFVCAPISKRLGHRLGPYHGYASRDALDRPHFSFDEAERIASGWRELPAARDGTRYDAHYDSIRKAFRFFDAETGVWHTWAGEHVGIATLYPIGQGAWRWDCGS